MSEVRGEMWKLPFAKLALRTACPTCGAKPFQKCSHNFSQVSGPIHANRLRPILQKFGEPIVCVLVFDDSGAFTKAQKKTADVEEAYNYWRDATSEYPGEVTTGKLNGLKSWIEQGNYGSYRVGIHSILSVEYRLKGGIDVAV